MRVVAFISRADSWSAKAMLVTYARHAAAAGMEATIAVEAMDGEATLRLPEPTPVGTNPPTGQLPELKPGPDDVVMFGAAFGHHALCAHYSRSVPRFVHLLTNDRATVEGSGNGYGLRLFAKPMVRIAASQAVYDFVAARLEDRAGLTLVPVGFDADAFRQSAPRVGPVRVALSAADGGFANRVVEALEALGTVFRVDVIHRADPVAERVAILGRASIFLAAPFVSEAVHLPSLEAMAAGCAVVIPAGPAAEALPGGPSAVLVVDRDPAAAAAATAALDSDAIAARGAAAGAAVAGLKIDDQQTAITDLLAGVAVHEVHPA